MNYMEASVLKALRKNFFISRFIHCHPFEWNQDTKLPQAVRSWHGIFHWHFNMYLVIAYTCFVQFRSIQVFLEPESSPLLCNYMQLMAFWYMVCSGMQLMFVGKCQQWEMFFQKHMGLMEQVWDDIDCGSGRTAKLFRTIALLYKLIVGSFWMNTLFLSLNSVLRPWSPEMLSSLVPRTHEAHWAARAICGSLHFYINLISEESWAMMLCYLFLIYLTIKDVTILLSAELMKSGQQRRGKVWPVLLHYHRCLTLQVNELQHLSGTIFGCILGIVLLTIVFCGYEAVNLGGLQAAGLGFIALNWTAMLATYCKMLADVNSESAAFLERSMKMAARLDSGMQRQALRKELRSIVEMRVKFRDMLYYDGGIVLTALQIVLVNTMNMILAK